ncbi:MAG: hypothetical protein JO306_15740, partial [Gemmatimonadetes bacterium]|nr:hypothetical protein [Gemmatimonadota bacterium]
IYEQLDQIDREEAEAAFAAGGREIGLVLLRLAMHWHDWAYVERVMPALMTLWADPDVSGWADDALDDVETFCKVERKRWAH